MRIFFLARSLDGASRGLQRLRPARTERVDLLIIPSLEPFRFCLGVKVHIDTAEGTVRDRKKGDRLLGVGEARVKRRALGCEFNLFRDKE